MGGRVAQWTDEVMEVLLSNLGDNSVHRTVKPQILSVFGDIALAVGPEFRKYLEHVLQTLMQVGLKKIWFVLAFILLFPG
jgi:importin subunit beta-1